MLPRISGFVGVVAQDYDGEINAGWRRLDRLQGHWHSASYSSNTIGGAIGRMNNNNVNSYTAMASNNVDTVRDATTDGTNGTPRTGKTTDPRTYGQYVYTHAGALLA
jgi:hypothetical protein